MPHSTYPDLAVYLDTSNDVRFKAVVNHLDEEVLKNKVG